MVWLLYGSWNLVYIAARRCLKSLSNNRQKLPVCDDRLAIIYHSDHLQTEFTSPIWIPVLVEVWLATCLIVHHTKHAGFGHLVWATCRSNLYQSLMKSSRVRSYSYIHHVMKLLNHSRLLSMQQSPTLLKVVQDTKWCLGKCFGDRLMMTVTVC